MNDEANETPMIHVISSGLTIMESVDARSGRVLRRGDEILITPDLIAANCDRLGNSAFALIDDPEAQRQRWGREVFRRGPWPAEELKFEPNSAEHRTAREIARREAHSILDPAERMAALRGVEKVFGPLPSTAFDLGVTYR